MRVYFVRHGLTEGLENKYFQLPSTPLSENGRGQARFVARRFKNIPIDVLVSSPYVRALETAEIISKQINKPIITSKLFREIKRPTVIEGKFQNDKKARAIMDKVIKNFCSKPHWHHSDEDNFTDMKNRALKAISYLSKMKHSHVLVATHGFILRMIFACLLMGKELKPSDFNKIDFFFRTANTGITVLEYEKGQKESRFGRLSEWRTIAWNDHAHLS